MRQPDLQGLNRNFGLIMAGGCGALALLRYVWSGAAVWWLMGVGLAFLGAGLAGPLWLDPVPTGGIQGRADGAAILG